MVNPTRHHLAAILLAALTLVACDPEGPGETADEPFQPFSPPPLDNTTPGDSTATAVAAEVDQYFDETSSATLILASRHRHCDTDDDQSCTAWAVEIPYDPIASLQISWHLIFDLATNRSLNAALGRSTHLIDEEEADGEGRTARQAIVVHRHPITTTIDAKRHKTYADADQASWAAAAEALDDLAPDPTQILYLSISFTPYQRPPDRHQINWFEHHHHTHARRQIPADPLPDLLRTSQERFDSLGLCTWVAGHRLVHGATIACTEEELRQLLDLRPPPIAGIYLDEVDEVGTGEVIRSDSGARLGRFLDAPPPGDLTGIHSPDLADWRPITVAYPDPQGFVEPHLHPAFDKPSPLCLTLMEREICFVMTRIHRLRRCDRQGCTTDLETTYTADPTGNHGGQILGGLQSVLNGQDPLIDDQQARSHRSYGGYGARLQLSYVPSAIARIRALEEAATVEPRRWLPEAHIWGYSATTGSCDDPRGHSSLWTQILDTAYDRGLVAVQIAGNSVERWASGCSTPALAARSDVLVVGAFGHTRHRSMDQWRYDREPLAWTSVTDLNASDRCPGLQANSSGDRCFSSAEGGADLFVDGARRSRARTVIDLTAPSGRRYSAVREDGISRYREVCCGTSHAAPIVTAAMVSLRDWGRRRELSVYDDPTVLYTLALMSGDATGEWASRHTSDPLDQRAHRPSPTARPRAQFSRIWGAGRLWTHRFTGPNNTLPPPSYWTVVHHTFADTEPHWHRLGRRPIDSLSKQVEAILAWDEPNLSGRADRPAAKIDIALHAGPTSAHEVCLPTPQGPTVLLGRDRSFDTKRRVLLQAPFFQEHPELIGQCLYLRVDPASLPGPRHGAYAVRRSGD